jgi:hypothetical protein
MLVPSHYRYIYSLMSEIFDAIVLEKKNLTYFALGKSRKMFRAFPIPVKARSNLSHKCSTVFPFSNDILWELALTGDIHSYR